MLPLVPLVLLQLVAGTPGSASCQLLAADSPARPAPDRGAGSEPAPFPIPTTSYHFYVASTGLDTNPGTWSAPFRTIARAARAALPSSTVHVAPGTYPGGFRTTVNGTAAGRIYFVSTVKWGATIVPPVLSRNKMAWDNRGDYVDIIGFRVDGSAWQGGTKWTYGIYNGGSHDMIRNNWVHDIARNAPCTSAGGSAIGIDSYYRGVQSDVVGNLVHDIGPPGCRFVQGIYISTSGTVRNNVVYRVSEAAINLWHDANNVVIANNTVSTSGVGIVVGGGDYYFTSAGANDVHVHSNIVYDNKYGISERGRTGTGNTYRNNLVYKNVHNWTLQNRLTHRGTVAASPQFISYARTGKVDLRPGPTSPAIGKGNATFALPYDFDNRPRNPATGYDIGALQH
ncbi:MAG TPA: DUF1565 domain-containing protein [Telluria sp.]